MANRIIPKRSSVAAKVPLATDLSVGEIALNLADKKLFTKDGSGAVIDLSLDSAAVFLRVQQSSAQSYSSGSLGTVAYQSVVEDTASMWSSADNQIIISASANNKIAILTVQNQDSTDTSGENELRIERSQDGGTTWDRVAQASGFPSDHFGLLSATAVLKVATGERFRVLRYASVAKTSAGNQRCSFTFCTLNATKGDPGPPGSGSGDMVGPNSSTNNNIAVFDGITGKLIKNGGATVASLQPALGFTPYNATNPSGYITSSGSITGNAGTVTNGVYTTGSYADPTWITSLNYSKLTGTIPTWNQNTTGSAATLTTGRTIALTGDVTYTSGSFNGSTNVTGAATLANSGVAAGTYTKLTVDAKGRATTGATLAAADIPALTMASLPGAAYKQSARAATTANITLSGTQTIDGVAVVAGDRVLVKNQTTASQNGIYVVAAGAWTRSADADAADEIGAAVVNVDSGTANGGELWTTRFRTTDTLGTTAMSWSEVLYNSGTWAISVSGSAATLTTARTLTIGSTGKTFNGSANVTWTDNEILPARLRAVAQTITDWNSATENGWYMGSNILNAPSTAWHIGFVEAHNGNWTTQTVHAFSSDTESNGLIWRREQNNGTWGSWYRLRWSETEQDARYAQVNGTGASGTWGISITGNAATATNVAYTGLTGTVPTWNQNTTGSAATLTTARTLTVGNTGKTFNGSANVSWTSAEIVNRATAPADTYASWGDGVHLANPEYPAGTGSIVASFVLNGNRGIQLATSSYTENTPLQFRRIHTAQPNGLGAWQELVDNLSTQTIGGVKTFSSTIQGSISGSANSAATLTTGRTLTIGDTGKTFNGSANVAWSLAEIGAQPAGNYVTTDTAQTISGVKTFANPELKIGSSNTENYISFHGTTGDGPGLFNHTYVGEYKYGGTESSELIFFKGNDIEGSSGPDRIRHIAVNHLFQTYTAPLSGTFAAVAAATGPQTRMFIGQDGNVGIGTSAPTDKLQVNTQDGVRLGASGSVSYARIGSATTGESTAEVSYERSTGSTIFSQGATGSALNERMRISNAGNVGIGIAAPTQRLHVDGNILATGSIDCGTQFLGLATDSAAAPSFSFTGDTNTGIYRNGADSLGFSTNGISRLSITTAQFTATLPWRGQNGTAAAPAFSASADTNTGMYFPAADTIGFTEGGVEVMRISSAGNVGIGNTTSGSYKLEVTGASYASGVIATGDIEGTQTALQVDPAGTAVALAIALG